MVKSKTKKKPNPGSQEAREMGCHCPVLDNSYGKGYYGQKDVFVIVSGCPIHDKQVQLPDVPKKSKANS